MGASILVDEFALGAIHIIEVAGIIVPSPETQVISDVDIW